MCSDVPLNRLSFAGRLFFSMCSCILSLRLFDILRVLGAPCLAVIGLITLWLAFGRIELLIDRNHRTAKG